MYEGDRKWWWKVKERGCLRDWESKKKIGERGEERVVWCCLMWICRRGPPLTNVDLD